MDTLPPEIVHMITNYLDPKSIRSLRTVSSKLNQLSSNLSDDKEYQICMSMGRAEGKCGDADCAIREYSKYGSKNKIIDNMFSKSDSDNFKYLVENTDITYEDLLEVALKNKYIRRNEYSPLSWFVNEYDNKIDDQTYDKLLNMNGIELFFQTKNSKPRTNVVTMFALKNDFIDDLSEYIDNLDLLVFFNITYVLNNLFLPWCIFPRKVLMKSSSLNVANFYALNFLPYVEFEKYYKQVNNGNLFAQAIESEKMRWFQYKNKENIELLLKEKITFNLDYVFTNLDTPYSLTLRDDFRIKDAVLKAFNFSISKRNYEDASDMIKSDNLDHGVIFDLSNYDLHYLEIYLKTPAKLYVDKYNSVKDKYKIITSAFICNDDFPRFYEALNLTPNIIIQSINQTDLAILSNVSFLLDKIDSNYKIPQRIIEYIIRSTDSNFLYKLHNMGYGNVYEIYIDNLPKKKYSNLLEMLNDYPMKQKYILLASLPNYDLLEYLYNNYEFDENVLYSSTVLSEVSEYYSTPTNIYGIIWGEYLDADDYYGDSPTSEIRESKFGRLSPENDGYYERSHGFDNPY